jgi:hypothetical protein
MLVKGQRMTEPTCKEIYLGREEQKITKLPPLVNTLRNNFSLWQKKISQAWCQGNEAGYGFAIGEIDDKAATALIKEGYELIHQKGTMAIGSNGINAIIAVVDVYGPWAVDITHALIMHSNGKEFSYGS